MGAHRLSTPVAILPGLPSSTVHPSIFNAPYRAVPGGVFMPTHTRVYQSNAHGRKVALVRRVG
eukprot:7343788-Prymnesium_polylepis.1